MGVTNTGLSTSRWAPKPTQKSLGTTSTSCTVPSPLSQPPLTSKNLVGPTNTKVKMSQPKLDSKLDNLPGLQTSRWAVNKTQPPVECLAACVVIREALRAAMDTPEVKVTLEPTKFDWANEVEESDEVVHVAEVIDTPASRVYKWLKLTEDDNARYRLK